MSELLAQVMAVARAMWRRRWIGLAVTWVVAIVAAVMVARTPERYEANARVYVNTKSVLKPLLRDLSVEPDLDQTLQLLVRIIITRPNIETLIKKARLEKPGMTDVERDRLIDQVSRDIRLSALGRDNVFAFSYRDVDPNQAKVVVEQLVALFVDSDLSAKTRDVDVARGFIDQQIKTYEARLSEAENRLKEFKMRNMEMSDPTGKDYFSRISALSEELSRLNLDLRAAEQSRDALRRELGGETATLLPDTPVAAVAVSTPEIDARLDAQHKQLDELLRRYTDLHPDVISTRRLIARLEEQKAQEVEARRKMAAAQPKVAGPGGAESGVQQTKLALAEAEATVAALRVRAADTQSRLAQMRSEATRVPKVEAELAQLNRDYDIVKRNYEALVMQREKAAMSEEIDSTRLAHFRIIDPPRTSDMPVFPNRLALAGLALLFSLAAGVVATFLVVQLLPTVNSSVELRQLTNRPVLGSVSMLVNDDMLRQARVHLWAFFSGVGGLVVLYAIWMAWLSMPKAM